jgi:hypothetical protein
MYWLDEMLCHMFDMEMVVHQCDNEYARRGYFCLEKLLDKMYI